MTQWYAANLILIQGTMLTFLMSLSIQFPMRLGVFSFAGIACYAIGAYTSANVVLHTDLPPYLGLLLGVVLSVAVSIVLALIVRRLKGLYLAMATISVALIVQTIAYNGGEFTGGGTGLFGVISSVDTPDLVVFTAIAILALILTERGKLGRRIEAVREDPELALSMGTNVNRYRLIAFIVGAVFGALSGGLIVLLRSTVSPTNVGFTLTVTALTVIIIGGYKSWIGAAIGSILVTWLPHYLEAIDDFQHIVFGLLVVLAAIFVPGGLLGIVDRIILSIRQSLTRRRQHQKDDAPTDPGPRIDDRKNQLTEEKVV